MSNVKYLVFSYNTSTLKETLRGQKIFPEIFQQFVFCTGCMLTFEAAQLSHLLQNMRSFLSVWSVGCVGSYGF